MDKPTGKIRAARLDKSKRLQAVFWLMADGREHSTWEVITTCKRCAINSIMAELRDKDSGNELTIPPAKVHDGGHWYRMELDAKFYEWRRRLLAQGEAVNG
ncbi:MAG: hypothetical protein A2Y38_16795 [Spirochaetes bacterium GWB1_59_5]|nr:MAG: hypothetical protein A2Y38_16795 [Spirochaetes bacterium GWB1_59_5]